MQRPTLSAVCLTCAVLLGPAAAAQGRFRILVDDPAQTLLGFGGSQVFELERWVHHPTPDALHQLLFDDLGLDILRLEMVYQRASVTGLTWQERLDDQLALLSEAEARGVTTTMITSWSPPANLKDNGSVNGGTLARDPNGDFVYDDYANWWVDGLLEYAAHGVTFDYLSPQNEPSWADVYPTCQFAPTETATRAGYVEAYQALHARLALEPSLTPFLMACESAGYWDLDAFLTAAAILPWIDAWTHHMYGLNWTTPVAGVPLQQDVAANWGDRPIFQTEYSSLQDPIGWLDGIHLAHHIHNVMVEESAAAFLFWSLAWRDGHNEMDGLVQVYEPSANDPTIIVRDCYWGLRHFSKFLGKDDQRLNTQTLNWSDQKVSAYRRQADGAVVLVVVNPHAHARALSFELAGMNAGAVTGYLSTDGSPFAPQSGIDLDAGVTMPPHAILTLEVLPACGPVPGCAGVPNSTGQAATVTGIGSGSIAANDLSLLVEHCPPQTFGLMFLGQGAVQIPLGNGILCAGSPLYRMPVMAVDAAGSATVAIDHTNPATLAVIDPGSTWTYQFWFRDVAAGGAFNSLSGGVDVTFCR